MMNKTQFKTIYFVMMCAIPTYLVYLYRSKKLQSIVVQNDLSNTDSRSSIKPTLCKVAHLLGVGFFD